MINWKEIDVYIANVPKPSFCEVPEEEFRNALRGAQEALSNGDIDKMDTEEFWNLLYFSAMYFCKGMMYAEIKAGLRPEYTWPIY